MWYRKPFSEEVALVMMVLRLNTLLKGHSGATLELVEQLKFFINERIIPVIPQQGSLGASGFSTFITSCTCTHW